MRAINYPLSSRSRARHRPFFYSSYSAFWRECKKKMVSAHIFSREPCRPRNAAGSFVVPYEPSPGPTAEAVAYQDPIQRPQTSVEFDYRTPESPHAGAYLESIYLALPFPRRAFSCNSGRLLGPSESRHRAVMIFAMPRESSASERRVLFMPDDNHCHSETIASRPRAIPPSVAPLSPQHMVSSQRPTNPLFFCGALEGLVLV